MQKVPTRVLPVIVFSQFAGTSLWFATNAVMPDLQRAWGLPASAVGTLTSAVQLGFVAGTLVFALLMVADRYPPTRVFLACAVLGALANAAAVAVIASGFAGCVVGGLLVRRFGSARVAAAQLATSGLCGLAGPFLLDSPLPVFLAWLLVWGATVAGDSPQFSTLTARNSPPQFVGSVLTFTNSIGFGITVASIELFVRAAHSSGLAAILPWLAVGPALGLWMLRPLLRSPAGQGK